MIIITKGRAQIYHQNIFKMESDKRKTLQGTTIFLSVVEK